MPTDATDELAKGQNRLISSGALGQTCTQILSAAGLCLADAELVADTLVQADLWGHQSHGTLRVPAYVARLKSGAVDAKARPTLTHDRGPVGVMDGKNAMGQVVAGMAMELAIERARAFGVGAISVHDSNHFGTAMYFTLMAAREGCIGFVATNASPAMPPWGGKTKAVGTNPWSWAAPAGEHCPMVLDIANTAVARGKIHLARQRGEPIPTGWALGPDGLATTDPDRALSGVTLPMAGHKGYGIALMMDVLAGVLSGSAFGSGVSGPFQSERPGRAGHFVLALNVEAFMPLQEFGRRQEALIQALKASPLADGFAEILYPGEPEARLAEKSEREGISLPAATVEALAQLCRDLGITMPLSS